MAMLLTRLNAPGTVSKILWHFTGGPAWDERRKRQENRPKNATKAYKALIGILKSKELRRGGYQQCVKVQIPEYKQGKPTGKLKTVELVTERVCCLADIPVAHLRYHAHRYGKFAIGFYRDAVVQAGFNPVLYTISNHSIIQRFYESAALLNDTDFYEIKSLSNSYRSYRLDARGCINDYEEESERRLYSPYLEGLVKRVEDGVAEIENYAQSYDDALKNALVGVEQVMAFIKTFNEHEFDTIYCEREWRSLEAFQFDFSAVAMIVLPRKVSSFSYFDDFVRRILPRLKLPRKLPILPWEDLVEH